MAEPGLSRRMLRLLLILISAALLILFVAAAWLFWLSRQAPEAPAPMLQATGPRWQVQIPPTPVNAPPLVSTPASDRLVASPTFVPLYPGIRAAWVADLTVEDDSVFAWGEVFTKTWRLVNVGAETWPTGTLLSFVRGDALAGKPVAFVGGVASGATVDVSVRLVAPRKTGAYVSGWALTTGGARIPGSDVWVAIQTTAPASLANLAAIRGKFELGGHVSQGFTHVTQMRQAGMTWVKVQARYGEDADLRPFIAEAHAQGFKVLISAVGSASMVTESGFSRRVSDWMAGIAAAGADAIEVWNEPNLPREWRQGYISPRAYTNLLCTAYSAIKRANRGTLVISAAPAPTGYFNGCTGKGCDDALWLEGLVATGAAGCFDYLGAHHNAGATSPSSRTGHSADLEGKHHSWYFLPQTELYYEQFAGKRQLFYTELGYLSADGYGWIPDSFSWAGNISTAMQAAWLAEAAELSRESGMVRALVIWNVDATCYGDCGSAEDPQGGYAIIRPNGACPACETLEALELP
ncbi:MAG: hypothetical protein BWY63_00875 [Chloroflexi bacterium ADurb.Bin360]|nr:MAG: hypothetical protein BWY63_00875 [Chloroflexi bacterium ADurb.Bin360]